MLYYPCFDITFSYWIFSHVQYQLVSSVLRVLIGTRGNLEWTNHCLSITHLPKAACKENIVIQYTNLWILQTDHFNVGNNFWVWDTGTGGHGLQHHPTSEDTVERSRRCQEYSGHKKNAEICSLLQRVLW
jgi:hypothetical protein